MGHANNHGCPSELQPSTVKAKTRGFELCGGVRTKDNIFGMWGYSRGHVDQLTNVLDRYRQVFRVTQLQGRGGLVPGDPT